MWQDFLLNYPLPLNSALSHELTIELTGPSAENIALGLSSCSRNLRSMSSSDPMTSVMSMVFFLSRMCVLAVTLSLEEGRYPLIPLSLSFAFYQLA